ncbi:hypothetical protein [Acerihabitans sp.]|uniref:hypothetical protein n=1 Tax=Acerihabitans sp. TaxID=2811394 RepID=UPI002EDB1653
MNPAVYAILSMDHRLFDAKVMSMPIYNNEPYTLYRAWLKKEMMSTFGLTRCAFFQGCIRPGMELAFYQHVNEVMVPLWSHFPKVREVRVWTQENADIGEPAYPLVMVMRFDSQADIDQALLSPVREESKRKSGVLVDMFDGTIFHTVFNNVYCESGTDKSPISA